MILNKSAYTHEFLLRVTYLLQVRNGPLGLSLFLPSSFPVGDERFRSFRLLPHISSINPSSGSVKGNALVTILGGGFVEDVTVIGLGNVITCDIVSLSYTQIECRTSEYHGMGNYVQYD